MKAVSFFSSAGISELFLSQLGIDIVCANEIKIDRANLYQDCYKKTKMIQGNILSNKIFKALVSYSQEKCDLLIASPPCQGMSMAGKSRNPKEMLQDERNYLIYRVIDFINEIKPHFALIENVPLLTKLQLPYKNKILSIIDIMHNTIGDRYNIEMDVLDCADFRIPQHRLRTIIRIYKKGNYWHLPSRNEEKLTVHDTISHLPSIEAGETSSIKWHYARRHSKNHILWMKNTPTGMSAFQNEIYFPRKSNGDKINGYDTTYRRMEWHKPAPTITTRNDAISSQRNVHPGTKLNDGTYSDARALTPLELMLLSTIPESWNIPYTTNELLIRRCIGECVPPNLTQVLLSELL